jgi:hypothetical protein
MHALIPETVVIIAIGQLNSHPGPCKLNAHSYKIGKLQLQV